MNDLRPVAGEGLRGQYAIVHQGADFTQGCRIREVRHQDGRCILVLDDDPGFELLADGTSRHTWFPGRTWTNANRVEIVSMTQWAEQ